MDTGAYLNSVFGLKGKVILITGAAGGIGNAISRGNPLLEEILNRGLPYTSGPQWLQENILNGRHVLAVAGTHGKTTTTSMLAWILEDCGLNPRLRRRGGGAVRKDRRAVQYRGDQ